jgi:hypothetical protein
MRYLFIIVSIFVATTTFADTKTSLYLLSNADADSLYSGFQYALEKSPNHHAVDWSNPMTGLTGATVPIKSYRTSYGQVCREYLSTVQFKGNIQQAFGTACRQGDGSWKIAGEKPIKRAAGAMKFIYLKPQQVTDGCPFSSGQPPIGHDQFKRYHPGMKFHGDGFHEKFRSFERKTQPAPKHRQIEQEQPSKLLRLVAY